MYKSAFLSLILLVLYGGVCGQALAPNVWQAVEAGDEESLKNWLSQGGDPNLNLSDGTSLLHVAASRGEVSLARLLLANGADIDHRSYNGGTAVSKAISDGDILMVRLLADLGANLDYRYGLGRETILMMATRLGHYDVVGQLLLYEIPLNARDTALLSAKDYAKKYGHPKIKRMIKQAGGH